MPDTSWRSKGKFTTKTQRHREEQKSQIKSSFRRYDRVYSFLRTENRNPMPLIQVTMLQGRTADQKRKLAQRITDAMVEEAGARREAIVVTFVEVSKESYASGGVLMVDKNK
ncbi:MAG TPA: 2-hydroxymuconate tautomerase [Candidatus Sulfotelmatobacter sp.]|nr:2-hydroxymuconate tautomerase [Candidatus Sulfotelmatobacter sp.]